MNLNTENNTLAVEEVGGGYTVKAVGTGKDLLFMLTVLIGSVSESAHVPPEILGAACGAAATELATEDRTEIDMSHLLKHMQGGNTGNMK